MSCIGRRDGPRAAAMQPRSVPIACREPSTPAADVEPSRRDVLENPRAQLARDEIKLCKRHTTAFLPL